MLQITEHHVSTITSAWLSQMYLNVHLPWNTAV